MAILTKNISMYNSVCVTRETCYTGSDQNFNILFFFLLLRYSFLFFAKKLCNNFSVDIPAMSSVVAKVIQGWSLRRYK
jgi:hypothetical protein